MFASPSGAFRPLPPNPPPVPEKYEGNETPPQGPPILPPIESISEQPFASQEGNDSQGPLLDPSSSIGSPPHSPGFPAASGKAKKGNPLTDLIDSEEQFVALMGAIIRKVASAWSRSNFPPPELDLMFRGLEVVFKASRSFLSQLKDIGPNPSSPKALGDLLMRWVEDLEQPYNRYCEAFCVGFDQWDAVQSNPKLSQVLVDLSETIPPPPNTDPPVWTLDSLFLLPRTRLKYYKKLYARLLKSTQPGKSDHKLLLSATETLDRLFEQAEFRLGVVVGEDAPPPETVRVNVESVDHDLPPPPPLHDTRDSYGSSGRASSRSSAERMSRDTAQSSADRATSASAMASQVADLERRLSTDRVMDLFTMQPKQCRLQIHPPNLPFTRTLRLEADCVIYFTPKATGQELATTNAHEREHAGPDGPDMWLSYPPLAGKHLRVSDIQGAPGEHVLQVLILKKEIFYIHLETAELKERMRREFDECREVGSAMPPRNNGPVPPMPPPYPGPPNGTGRPPSAPTERRQSPFNDPHRPQGYMSDPSSVRFQENGQAFPARKNSLHDLHAQHSQSPPFRGPPPNGMGLPGTGLPGAGFGMPPPPGNSQFMPPPRGSSAPNGMPPRMQQGPPGGPGPLPPGPMPPGPPFHAHPPHHLGAFPPARQPSPGIPGPGPGPFPGNGMLPPHMGGPPGPGGPPPPPHMGGPPGPGGPGGYGPPGGMLRPGPPPGQQGQFGASRVSMAPSLAPSMAPSMRPVSRHQPADSLDDTSPPTSPVGPTTTSITAQMLCKVFLKQQHQQWKALGSGRLKLYHTQPTNVKQLVVESDSKNKALLISTIVLTDGVERLGKTGIAVELSDQGARTGIVYMVQLRNEQSTQGLFDGLLAGSDRGAVTKRE